MVEHLTKRFGDRVAFDDVSFEVGYGEVFGFLGPNGAGKTTTVRTLGTLLTPTSGSATVAGFPLSAANGPRIRARISIMPESPGLYLRLTVTENLECFAALYELDDVRGRIQRALRAVNLADRAGDLCGALSKGLRQRVALARALLNDPAVLFLDEPTSGLDPVAAREVHELITSLRERGVTIFLTTHRLEEAERLCHRVAILNTTLLLAGRPAELREQLFTRSLDVRIRAPLDDPGRVFDTLPGLEGWQQVPSGYTLAVTDPQIAAPAGLIFLALPAIQLFVKVSATGARLDTRIGLSLLYLLIIPAIAPSALSAYSVVGEREQGTLEPVLITPIRREEFLVGKALAVLVPALVVSYAIFAVFLALADLVARPGVASAVFAGSHLLIQLLFTPLLAGWSIWVGIAMSARSADVRVAQQLGVLASLPPLTIVALITLNVIPASAAVALGLAGALLLVDGLGWRVVAGMFDRERLVAGTS